MSIQKYKQVRLKYDSGAFEVSFIPTQFAKLNKKILVGKNKKKALPATVLEVYDSVALTEEYLQINKNHPLWKVTDI